VNYFPGPDGPVDAAGRAPTTGVRGADAIAVPAGGLIAGGLIPVGAATPKEPAGKPAGKRVRPKYTPPDVGDPTAQLSDSLLTAHVAPPRGAARLYRLPQDPSQELVCSSEVLRPFKCGLYTPSPTHHLAEFLAAPWTVQVRLKWQIVMSSRLAQQHEAQACCFGGCGERLDSRSERHRSSPLARTQSCPWL
jgi:hypothetical protein